MKPLILRLNIAYLELSWIESAVSGTAIMLQSTQTARQIRERWLVYRVDRKDVQLAEGARSGYDFTTEILIELGHLTVVSSVTLHGQIASDVRQRS